MPTWSRVSWPETLLSPPFSRYIILSTRYLDNGFHIFKLLSLEVRVFRVLGCILTLSTAQAAEGRVWKTTEKTHEFTIAADLGTAATCSLSRTVFPTACSLKRAKSAPCGTPLACFKPGAQSEFGT